MASSYLYERSTYHRYFLINDKVVSGDLEIKHAPTEKIWSDVLTKPHQYILFKITRAELMDVDVNYDGEFERKNMHPKLLPQYIEILST